MKWRVSIDFIGAPFMPKRELNKIIAAAFHDVGVYWHDHFRKRHFTNLGFSLYGYKPRSRKYWFRKLRKTGQALPLVFSGRSRELSKNATIRSTFKKVEIAMPTNTLNLRPKGGKINMAEELRTIARSEHAKLEQVMGTGLRSRLRSARGRTRVIIGGR